MDCSELLRTNVTAPERRHLEFLASSSPPARILSGCKSLADYIRQGNEYSTSDVEDMFNKAFEPSGICGAQSVMQAFNAVVEPRERSIEKARVDICGVAKVLENSDIESMCLGFN